MPDEQYCISSEQRTTALAELRRCLQMPVAPVPEESLRLLYDAACMDTGGSQACRNFLFWLIGERDPTGFRGDGGLELRRLDGQLKTAAIEVLTWWAGPTKSDAPLYDILARLRERFGSSKGDGTESDSKG